VRLLNPTKQAVGLTSERFKGNASSPVLKADQGSINEA
jgi:hypothetical protein